MKFIYSLLLSLALGLPVFAQGVTVTASALKIETVTGACRAGQVRVKTDGTLQTCQSGTWGSAAGFSGSYSGAVTFTTNSANGLVVGANGTTNPVLKIDASAASVATGISIAGAASGSGVTLAAIGGTNEALNLSGKGTGGVNVGAGTASNPALRFGDTSTGIYQVATNTLGISTAGTERLRIATGNLIYSFSDLYVANGFQINLGTSANVGIARLSNGIARVTNGTTGVGALGAALPVASKTSGYSVLNTDTGYAFDNIGASGSVTFTLPTPAAGLNYKFCRVANQAVVVDVAAGVTIQSGASATTSGGDVSLSAVGSCLHIWAVSTTQWFGLLAGTASFN